MPRQTVKVSVSHIALEGEELTTMRSYNQETSIRIEINVYNHTTQPLGYYDRRFGVLHAAPLGPRYDGKVGVYVAAVVDIPLGTNPTLSTGWGNELLQKAIQAGNFQTYGRAQRYRYGSFIDAQYFTPGVIVEDKAVGVFIGDCWADWSTLSENVTESAGLDTQTFRGHFEAIEFIDDDRESIYLAGLKTVKPVRASTTRQTGRRPGLYVTSYNELGERSVKFYGNVESCRSEADIPVFAKYHEAEQWLERSAPQGKKGGPTTASLSDLLNKRSDRFYAASANAAKGGQVPPEQDKRSRYEKSSNGRHWSTLCFELADSIITKVLMVTHQQGFGKWV